MECTGKSGVFRIILTVVMETFRRTRQTSLSTSKLKEGDYSCQCMLVKDKALWVAVTNILVEVHPMVPENSTKFTDFF